jgi:hypothetical protein
MLTNLWAEHSFALRRVGKTIVKYSILEVGFYMQKAGLGFPIGTACCMSGYLSTWRL